MDLQELYEKWTLNATYQTTGKTREDAIQEMLDFFNSHRGKHRREYVLDKNVHVVQCTQPTVMDAATGSWHVTYYLGKKRPEKRGWPKATKRRTTPPKMYCPMCWDHGKARVIERLEKCPFCHTPLEPLNEAPWLNGLRAN